MHRGHFAKCRIGQVNVQRLTLINESPTVSRHVYQIFLRYLPNSSVQFLQLIWNGVYLLNGAIVGYDLILYLIIPQV
ncbi:hypothetical protein BpHYR1_023805 [Brachionus plicatilis]|uniref:Uncharacterized protein n=1 Tax=Brachionus plicatilis TaxID=10195 RepID=A0A3M7PDB2_BRAPC|nr:hypothetical protein BpHYR1_023805 [Brachionus plicatilis]